MYVFKEEALAIVRRLIVKEVKRNLNSELRNMRQIMARELLLYNKKEIAKAKKELMKELLGRVFK